MQTCADGEYKFMFDYQNHLTKFIVLRALKIKSAEVVVYNIIDVFYLLSALIVLQSDNGRYINR